MVSNVRTENDMTLTCLLALLAATAAAARVTTSTPPGTPSDDVMNPVGQRDNIITDPSWLDTSEGIVPDNDIDDDDDDAADVLEKGLRLRGCSWVCTTNGVCGSGYRCCFYCPFGPVGQRDNIITGPSWLDTSEGTVPDNDIDDDDDDDDDALSDNDDDAEGFSLRTEGAADVDMMLEEGLHLSDLSAEEVEDQDNRLMYELDVTSLRQAMEERRGRGSEMTEMGIASQGLRKKRWAPVIAAAGRILFAGAVRAARTWKNTRQGRVMTQQYNRSGNFRNAVRDFNNMGVQNVSRIRGRTSGYTGTLGNHRITVRSRSGRGGTGPPTIDVRTPRGSHTTLRKFRYNMMNVLD